MLGQRRRRLASIKPILVQCVIFAHMDHSKPTHQPIVKQDRPTLKQYRFNVGPASQTMGQH